MYIRTRLAVLVTLLVGITLALVGTATYKLLRHGLLTEIERDVTRRAATFAASRPQPPYPLDVFAAPDVFLQVVNAGEHRWPAREISAAACCPWTSGCAAVRSSKAALADV